MSHGPCPMSRVTCPTSRGTCPLSRGPCPMSGVTRPETSTLWPSCRRSWRRSSRDAHVRGWAIGHAGGEALGIEAVVQDQPLDSPPRRPTPASPRPPVCRGRGDIHPEAGQVPHDRSRGDTATQTPPDIDLPGTQEDHGSPVVHPENPVQDLRLQLPPDRVSSRPANRGVPPPGILILQEIGKYHPNVPRSGV